MVVDKLKANHEQGARDLKQNYFFCTYRFQSQVELCFNNILIIL